MRICGRNFRAGIACSILLFSLFFTALPNWLFADLIKVEWFWGCPVANYVVEHSIDGNSSGFMWHGLVFDVLFWILYFSLFGVGGGVLLRKIGLKIRPGFCLIALWLGTVALYAYLYRPDILINVETGGYLSFLESPTKQVDLAMRFGDVEKLQALFREHPDLVSAASITGKTPLHQAAYWGQTEIVKLLLADKADIEARDMNGYTPLFDAAICGNTGAAELLIRNGAKVNVMGHSQETPLMLAAGWGHNSMVLLLLANKANVTARDFEGMSALHEAAYCGYQSTAQLLIASNADVNLRDNDGETPLFCAAKAGRARAVQLLLSNGADASAVDMRGMTPIQVASNDDYTNIVEIFKQHGATNNGHVREP
jgi:Ankyrin repeats (3 copies)/Ankyrin repeats (many copies)/Ankyrin repeat